MGKIEQGTNTIRTKKIDLGPRCKIYLKKVFLQLVSIVGSSKLRVNLKLQWLSKNLRLILVISVFDDSNISILGSIVICLHIRKKYIILTIGRP